MNLHTFLNYNTSINSTSNLSTGNINHASSEWFELLVLHLYKLLNIENEEISRKSCSRLNMKNYNYSKKLTREINISKNRIACNLSLKHKVYSQIAG